MPDCSPQSDQPRPEPEPPVAQPAKTAGPSIPSDHILGFFLLALLSDVDDLLRFTATQTRNTTDEYLSEKATYYECLDQ